MQVTWDKYKHIHIHRMSRKSDQQYFVIISITTRNVEGKFFMTVSSTFMLCSFHASANAVRPDTFFFWLFMSLWICAPIPASRTLLTHYLEKCWTYFHQTFSFGALWDGDECFKFQIQKVKVQVHAGSIMLENALVGVVNAISWKLLDWISPIFQLWCILGQGWYVQFLRSKGQRSRLQHDQGPSIVRQVLICSC